MISAVRRYLNEEPDFSPVRKLVRDSAFLANFAEEVSVMSRAQGMSSGTSFAVPKIAADLFAAIQFLPAISLSLQEKIDEVFFAPTTGFAGNAAVVSVESAATTEYAHTISVFGDTTVARKVSRSHAEARWSLRSMAADYEYARVSDWDGAHAKPITDEVVLSAESLLASLPHIPAPSEVSPLLEGAISLVWDLPAGYLFISVGPKDVLHVFHDIPGLGKWERVTTMDNQMARQHLLAAVGVLRNQNAGFAPGWRTEAKTELLAAA